MLKIAVCLAVLFSGAGISEAVEAQPLPTQAPLTAQYIPVNAPLAVEPLKDASLPYQFKIYFPVSGVLNSRMSEYYKYITVNLQSRDMNIGIKRPKTEPALGSSMLEDF